MPCICNSTWTYHGYAGTRHRSAHSRSCKRQIRTQAGSNDRDDHIYNRCGCEHFLPRHTFLSRMQVRAGHRRLRWLFPCQNHTCGYFQRSSAGKNNGTYRCHQRLCTCFRTGARRHSGGCRRLERHILCVGGICSTSDLCGSAAQRVSYTSE